MIDRGTEWCRMQLDQSEADHRNGGVGRTVTCAEFRAAHAEYVDGFMDPAGVAAMRTHARECLPCARHDRSIRKGCELLAGLPDVRTGDDFKVRLRARLATDRARRRRLISTGQLIVPAAAIIAIVAAVAWSPLLRAGGTAEPIELAPVNARLPAAFDSPRLGNGAHLEGPRLYRAAFSLPGVWLGDVGVPHRHETTYLHQAATRDPAYPTVFLEPPAFAARSALLEPVGLTPVVQR
ncbi:MAG TPA: hypothetical protein VK837_10635 [Longimicrobiales bacterium]|nr:hypothetical protein [Longimicrobiales bacterium]